MGFPSPADDYREGALNLQDLVVHPDATYFIKMIGVAMEPTIHAGDVMVVDRALIPLDNQIVVTVYKKKFWVRRIVQTVEHITLMADNSTFVDIVIGPDEDFAVWGVVTHSIHTL